MWHVRLYGSFRFLLPGFFTGFVTWRESLRVVGGRRRRRRRRRRRKIRAADRDGPQKNDGRSDEAEVQMKVTSWRRSKQREALVTRWTPVEPAAHTNDNNEWRRAHDDDAHVLELDSVPH